MNLVLAVGLICIAAVIFFLLIFAGAYFLWRHKLLKLKAVNTEKTKDVISSCENSEASVESRSQEIVLDLESDLVENDSNPEYTLGKLKHKTHDFLKTEKLKAETKLFPVLSTLPKPSCSTFQETSTLTTPHEKSSHTDNPNFPSQLSLTHNAASATSSSRPKLFSEVLFAESEFQIRRSNQQEMNNGNKEQQHNRFRPNNLPPPFTPILHRQPRFNFGQKTLIIAVDATPRHIGGYVINQFTTTVEYYSTPSRNLPWILRNRTRSGNPTEFEMKNLLCALLLWEHVIVRHRKVAIFTDNSAIIGNSMYGSRVRSFINHLQHCKNVLYLNPSWSYVNSRENRDLFNEFIIPADYLSREKETNFIAHLVTANYGCSLSDIHELKFNGIRQKVIKWVQSPCSCGFQISRTGSLKRSMR